MKETGNSKLRRALIIFGTILVYALMLILILTFYQGGGEFIYEGF